jgi:glycine betaine/choline ABC-type transport system substrate-binding protein
MDRKTLGAVLIAALVALTACSSSQNKPIIVGSKNFTEQVVLGEIIAQHLEKKLNRRIERKLNLGGTLLAHQAIAVGEIDLYPEYTGTAVAAILKEQPATDPVQVLERMRAEYARIQALTVLDPLGVNNTFQMVVSANVAADKKLKTLSDAAKVAGFWKLGAGFEFQERRDGFAALTNYRIEWIAAPKTMDLGLLYKALEDGHVNMIAANATDGPLQHTTLVGLEDDQHVFPPYQAVIVVRQPLIAQMPELKPALDQLAGKLSNETMRKLNAQVDIEKKRPEDVATAFLKTIQ